MKETFHPPEEGEPRFYFQPHLPHDVLVGSQKGVLLYAHDFRDIFDRHVQAISLGDVIDQKSDEPLPSSRVFYPPDRIEVEVQEFFFNISWKVQLGANEPYVGVNLVGVFDPPHR